MNPRYRSYRRNAEMFYVLDSQTRKRESPKTTDPGEAFRLIQTRTTPLIVPPSIFNSPECT